MPRPSGMGVTVARLWCCKMSNPTSKTTEPDDEQLGNKFDFEMWEYHRRVSEIELLRRVLIHARELLAEGRWITVAECYPRTAGSGNYLRDAIDALDRQPKNVR